MLWSQLGFYYCEDVKRHHGRATGRRRRRRRRHRRRHPYPIHFYSRLPITISSLAFYT